MPALGRLVTGGVRRQTAIRGRCQPRQRWGWRVTFTAEALAAARADSSEQEPLPRPETPEEEISAADEADDEEGDLDQGMSSPTLM